LLSEQNVLIKERKENKFLAGTHLGVEPGAFGLLAGNDCIDAVVRSDFLLVKLIVHLQSVTGFERQSNKPS